jgi:hypothetical protein
MSHPFTPVTRTVTLDGSRQRKTVNGCAFDITWPQQRLHADRDTLAHFLSRFGHCELVEAPADKRHWAQEFARQFNEHRELVCKASPIGQPDAAQSCGGAL